MVTRVATTTYEQAVTGLLRRALDAHERQVVEFGRAADDRYEWQRERETERVTSLLRSVLGATDADLAALRFESRRLPGDAADVRAHLGPVTFGAEEDYYGRDALFVVAGVDRRWRRVFSLSHLGEICRRAGIGGGR